MLSIYLHKFSDGDCNADDDIYTHILSVIHANAFEKTLTIESIASSCYCSKSMVSHIFKKRTGVSVNQYILSLRMEKAEGLLLNTDKSVTDIAYSCGYTDSNYFIYAFSKWHAVPPLKYRKNHQKNTLY